MENTNAIRELILNTKYPILLKQKLEWGCLKIPFESWCNIYDQELKNECVEFESAPRKHSDSPQWEKFREKTHMKLIDFYNNLTDVNNKFFEENFASLSYKTLTDMPEKCRSDVNLINFGFPEASEDEGTFWLTSIGGHTPCHYDTYGCNIVVQIYGKKRWLLFPPETKLTPIRVPYEESSVYCSENFYSPNFNNLKQFENCKNNCYECILEPGNILIVPKGWWHFVETLEPALTINHWIPLTEDSDEQIGECIVKYLIEKFSANESLNAKQILLNPNELDNISVDSELLSILNILNENKALTELERPSKRPMNAKQYPYQYLTNEQLELLIENLKSEFNYVEKMSEDSFLNLMILNSERYIPEITDEDETLNIKIKLINAICNPGVIQQIKDIFYENYK